MGRKRHRKERDGAADDLSGMLVKFIEVTEECEAKRRLLEAELEEKRRAEERKHEERMMTMMMTFMQSIAGSSQPDFRPIPPRHLIPPAFAPGTNPSPNFAQTTSSSNFPSEYVTGPTNTNNSSFDY